MRTALALLLLGLVLAAGCAAPVQQEHGTTNPQHGAAPMLPLVHDFQTMGMGDSWSFQLNQTANPLWIRVENLKGEAYNLNFTGPGNCKDGLKNNAGTYVFTGILNSQKGRFSRTPDDCGRIEPGTYEIKWTMTGNLSGRITVGFGPIPMDS